MAHFTAWLRLTLALAVVAGALPVAPSVQAQTPSPVRTPTPSEPGMQYFYENGHNIEEPFASFYAAQGGAARLGLPLTEKFVHPKTGVAMQYFQRARLDYDPNAPLQPVRFAPLGDEMGKRRPPAPLGSLRNDATCQYFPTTGHETCLAFGTYYKTNALETFFGPAIGPFVLEGNRTVQYFQNGRLDFLPEQPAANRVQIAELGLIHFELSGLDRQLLDPVMSLFGGATPITTLRARAQVRNGFIGPGNTQRITVRVVDQLSRPVPNALVTLTLKLSPTNNPSYAMPLTDSNGLTTMNVPAGSNVRTGSMVSVQVGVTRANLRTSTVTSYIIWAWGNTP